VYPYKRKRTLSIFGIAFIAVIFTFALLPIPSYAIDDPDTIAFGCGSDTNMYQVFQSVAESGDMLFVAESYVHYASTPTDYTAEQAFLFELIDTDGTTVIQSTPILEYEDYPTSLYFSADQVTSFGLTWQDTYVVRITGNPAIFGTPVEGTNQVSATLQLSDYITDSPAGTSVAGLRMFVISIATDLQEHDTPTYDYLVNVQGVTYLTTTGGNIFLDGIPNLNTFVPDVFQTTSSTIEYTPETSTGAYAGSLSYMTKLGPTIGNAVANFGTWMGMGSTMAGVVILFAIMLLVCGYAYVKTQNALVPDAIAMGLPFFGSMVGLVPLALAFTITIIIALLSLYLFWTRGVL
jgi:hypothetical protein